MTLWTSPHVAILVAAVLYLLFLLVCVLTAMFRGR